LSNWSALVELIRSSTAIVTAVSDGHASTGFRVALLDTAMKYGLRAVHMPGVTEDVFLASSLGIDFQELHLNATRVANTLTAAGEAFIHTISIRTGEAHCLNLGLDGRFGHADGGVTSPGEIINIPTGEAYIATIEDSAEGSLVVNGSFPECDLSSGREVVLAFTNGHLNLDACEFPEDGAGSYCQNLLLSLRSDTPEGMQVGELGIGLNPGIGSVEGRTILDEKVFGTCHIAIGSNAPFGGKNLAPYHLDLVFYPVAVFLDKTELKVDWKSRRKLGCPDEETRYHASA
jgi:aminopeptidase